MDVKKFITIALIGLPIAVSSRAACPAEDKTEESRYVFKRSAPTRLLDTYLTSIFSSDANSVRTMRGDILHTGKDTIVNFSINPSGVNYAVVSKNKKGGASARLYHTDSEDALLGQFDNKKYGTPRVAGFTPDARQAIVATDKSIYFLDPRKFQVVGEIANIPVSPDIMTISPNGFYLAIAGDRRVVVYNLETKGIRKEIPIEVKATELAFTPDNAEFAVLTEDGVLSLYNTRTFDLHKMVDDLGEARAASFNLDGKYMAVVINDSTTAVVNLLQDQDREYYKGGAPGVEDVEFIPDSEDNTILAFGTSKAIEALRMKHLRPFYNKLISEEADARMTEWLKMMPGETMEQYQARVTDETRQRQRRLFEEEAATRFAGDLLAGATMSLGSYDRANGVLALNFDAMPTIYLPVAEEDVTTFQDASELKLTDVLYGVLPDDSFEIVYAKVTNTANGKSYVYDNIMRSELQYMAADDAISLELLQQQRMEEAKLQELREKVVDEAKNMNVISDHTHIAVDSKVIPDYNADGKKILNYQVGVTYTVDPEFSAQEDFGPGKYHVEESGAASSMLNIVREAFEGDFKQYIGDNKKVKVRLLGTADATPIVRGIAYDGSYGDFEEEPVYIDGNLQALTVTAKNGIKENEQLAFLRALGVKDYLQKNVNGFKNMNADYRYEVNVSKDKGSQHRRITLELLFIDAY